MRNFDNARGVCSQKSAKQKCHKMILALKNYLHSVPVNAFAVTLVLGSTWPVSRESGMLDSASHVIRGSIR